jgi:RNA polymerase sigma-70 factor (ECF subfamily)
MLSFHDLYDTYAPEIYRFTLWLTGDSCEAEDITSETIIRAWVRISTIRTETLKAYLFTIARNIYREQQRKKGYQVPLYDVHPDPSPEPDAMVESQLEIQRVHRFLLTVPETDRAAFVLRVQHELSCAEIARVLGLSLTATKVKIHRVRKKLLAAFMEQEVE